MMLPACWQLSCVGHTRAGRDIIALCESVWARVVFHHSTGCVKELVCLRDQALGSHSGLLFACCAWVIPHLLEFIWRREVGCGRRQSQSAELLQSSLLTRLICLSSLCELFSAQILQALARRCWNGSTLRKTVSRHSLTLDLPSTLAGPPSSSWLTSSGPS